MGAITKQEASTARQRNNTGDHQFKTIDTADTGTTPVIMELGNIAQKITYVMNGTLTGTIEFSINGKDYTGSASLGSTGVYTTYSSHLVKKIKITPATGAGTVTVAAI